MDNIVNSSKVNQVVNYVFLGLFNFFLIGLIGFLMIDSHANLNSRVGGVLVSILIPYLIVSKTAGMNGLERMMKFGLGYIAYFAIAIFVMFYKEAYSILYSGLLPCLVLSTSILFYGKQLCQIKVPN